MKPFLEDILIPMELLGLESVMIPFFNFISTQRGAMAAKNAQQWMILDGAEFPRCFSGMETNYGQYTFDKLVVDRNVIVLKVLNKYGRFVDQHEVANNEMYTIICQDVMTSEIGFFYVSSYRFLSRGFGYFCKKHNRHMLTEGTLIPKGTVFQTSTAVDDNLYMMGLNANVIYLPILPTSEDACVISKSFAKKMSFTQFYQYVIRITENHIPCNTYGTEDGEHKFMPDIGERVRRDGLLAALRPRNNVGVLKDYTEERLRVYHPIHDEAFRCTPGAKVVDVDVYVNPRKWKEIKDPKSVYSQIAKYQSQTYAYYDEMAAVYEANSKQKFSPKLTSLLAKHALLKPGKKYGRPNEIFFGTDQPVFDGENPIDIAYVKVTVAIKKEAELGTKITGRDGSKGVISAIWPDEWMPYDMYGFRADLIMNSNAIVNRMNASQLFEQFFTRLGDLVVMDTMHLPQLEAYKVLMEFLYDFDAAYQEVVRRVVSVDPVSWVNEVRARGLYYNVPCTRSFFGEEHSLFMAQKWNYRTSKVKYTYPINYRKNITRSVESYDAECIGSKYIFCINKVPSCNAVELGYVSQLGLPIKNSGAKARFIAQTAIRFGEDESRVFLMNTDRYEVARFFNVSGNSFIDAQNIMRATLLTADPFAFKELPYLNEEIAKRSIPTMILNHLLGVAGINMTRSAVYKGVL